MKPANPLRTLFLAVLLICSPAWAGSKILVWGDSLSAGYGLRPQEAWPVLLGQKISTARLPYEVVNGSISGETTAGGLSRLPAALQAHKPSIVLIELGANDGLRGLPVKAMSANLQSMIDASRQAGAKVLLIGMRMPPNYGPAYTSAFEGAFRDLAKANRTRLVPFLMQGFADRPDHFQQDGIHPVATAQPLIVDTVWQELRPLLR
ncbi:arylesterase [Zoogloea sp. LCSB751]|uniref:arylesterase n=1 Tax=Zoogloea sp. LCSB751 TaxID=1965277 RepID=UPI0009A48611|nr:arylesterase [Zoogloea sp. LCSB751]